MRKPAGGSSILPKQIWCDFTEKRKRNTILVGLNGSRTRNVHSPAQATASAAFDRATARSDGNPYALHNPYALLNKRRCFDSKYH